MQSGGSSVFNLQIIIFMVDQGRFVYKNTIIYEKQQLSKSDYNSGRVIQMRINKQGLLINRK